MYKVGETLPDIGYPLITGDNLFISGVWFKCILVDFWSDWCDTCSENNNSLKAIYKEFGPKGLIILQISLGANPDSLKIQTARDSLFWYHASIQDYYHSKILDTLRVSSVPSNYIVDRRGVIKGVNLTGAKLAEKLAELLP
jgi:peroxiredoxin